MSVSINTTKKIWNKNLSVTRWTMILKNANILKDFRWNTKKLAFSPKCKICKNKSLVYWIPKRFLIQICLIGRRIHCSLWKYMIFHLFNLYKIQKITFTFWLHFQKGSANPKRSHLFLVITWWEHSVTNTKTRNVLVDRANYW